MTYYYALWIPQCEKGIPVIINDKLQKQKYQDKAEVPPFELEGTINVHTYNIQISFSLGTHKSYSFALTCTDKSEEGFLVYKLDCEDDEDNIAYSSFLAGMKKTVYHYVKGFFHKHQYHHVSDDSLLNAYCSTRKIDLSERAHKFAVINNYLTAYELKYSGYIDESLDTIKQVISQIEGKKRLCKNVKLIRASILNNLKVIEGEARYCNFLLDSCSDVIPQDDIIRLSRLYKQLRGLNERMTSIDSYLASEFSTQKAETGIKWSITGVVLAVLFFGYQYCTDRSKNIQEEMKMFRQEQGITNEQTRKQLDKTRSKQDSIVQQLNEVEKKVDFLRKKENKKDK